MPLYVNTTSSLYLQPQGVLYDRFSISFILSKVLVNYMNPGYFALATTDLKP